MLMDTWAVSLKHIIKMHTSQNIKRRYNSTGQTIFIVASHVEETVKFLQQI